LNKDAIRLPPLTPGRTFSDEYEVVLLVDGREQYSRYTGHASSTTSRNAALASHLQRMQGCGLAVEHRTLPIGDALWVARSRRNPATEYVLDYILERKSLVDLLGSIRDSNRYKTQKYFLKRCGLRHVYYLIEGDAEAMGEPREYKTVCTADAKTQVVDGFRVLRTKSVQDTFRLYQTMTEAIASLYCSLAGGSGSNGSQVMSFEAFKAHMKECNEGSTTLHDVWGRMLAEVSGLGPEGVAAVLESYPTPAALFKAYRDAILQGMREGRGGVAVAEALLSGLRTANGTRGIGPDKARKVYRELFMNRWNLDGKV